MYNLHFTVQCTVEKSDKQCTDFRYISCVDSPVSMSSEKLFKTSF